MTPEQKQRIEQIQEWKQTWLALDGYTPKDFRKDALKHVDFLLSLVRSQESDGEIKEAYESICGPVRDSAATSMRSACVEKVRALSSKKMANYDLDHERFSHLLDQAIALDEAVAELESLSIEQPKEQSAK